ncbi:MAG: diphthamide biosynthesis enzyme Dph2 [Candidatus Thermoplasmatota archaeon]
MNPGFDFEISRIVETAKRSGARQVKLQFPEGLRRHAHRVAGEIARATGLEVIVSGEPCHGACDLCPAAEDTLLVHFGHAPISPQPENVLFVEARASLPLVPAAEKALTLLRSPLGLVTTVQYVHRLQDVISFLRERGIQALVGKGGPRIAHPGQLLGCDVSAARAIAPEVSQFLYIGEGIFHPLAVRLALGTEVIAADPAAHQVQSVEQVAERFLRQRHAAIVRAQSAGQFGVLLCTKSGQHRPLLARRICEMLRAHGKEAVIIEMWEIHPMTLTEFGLDAYVSTACPRLALDDACRFSMPVLSPSEMEIALSLRRWEDYEIDLMDGPL